MKARIDFVTNSSSSSFIISRKEFCDKDEIRSNLGSMRDYIQMWLATWMLHPMDVDQFMDELTEYLFYTPSMLREDGWIEHRRKFSNDADIYQAFIYCFWSKLSTENFDVRKVIDE